jgi:hypothetical protein
VSAWAVAGRAGAGAAWARAAVGRLARAVRSRKEVVAGCMAVGKKEASEEDFPPLTGWEWDKATAAPTPFFAFFDYAGASFDQG